MYSKEVREILKKNYKELTSLEIKILRDKWVLNWFWWAGQSWIVRYFIWWILSDFDTAIPDYHDFWYAVWWNEERRKECDEKFYQAMLDDIRTMYHWWDIWKCELVWKSIVALLAYNAIRWNGSQYFHYR